MRYIHLNPLRGRLVRDLGALDRYPYAGHSVLMGRRENAWQKTGVVLGHFGRRAGPAREAYRAFVEAGISLGQRPELIGGGLIRSLGGWTAVQTLRGGAARRKGDERILGDAGFVLAVLEASEEHLRRQEGVQRLLRDLAWLARQVAPGFGLAPDESYRPSKRRPRVAARSVFCYFEVQDIGVTATAVARVLGCTQPAVSIAVKRGEQPAHSQDIRLMNE